MSVQLSNALIQAIIAQGDTPDTPEEWIIAAMNYLHSQPGGGTGDIKSDGSVNFTGAESFDAGLLTDSIIEKTAAAGVTIAGSGGLIVDKITASAGDLVISSINGQNLVIQNQSGNGTVTILDNGGVAISLAANRSLDITTNGSGTIRMNNLSGGTATIDTAVTPNLVFEKGIFISAS